jgi:arginase family enzyme
MLKPHQKRHIWPAMRTRHGATRAPTGILPLVSRISVVGVPSSAASYAAGQDLAPAALRSAGLLEQLIASGLQVHDDGDLPHQIWSPDRDHPLAQNAGVLGAASPHGCCHQKQGLPCS